VDVTYELRYLQSQAELPEKTRIKEQSMIASSGAVLAA
jgi:hypothetical protein